MSRYDPLIKRAQAGELILIDGATGSECTRRGVPYRQHGWSGGAALSHPDLVRRIHADYLELGADLIISNTFATGLNILEDVGVPEEFEPVNRQAVELAVQARNGDLERFGHVVVAGGISNWSFSGNRPSLDQLQANTVEQARIMAEAGAEMLILEMMVDLPRMTATLDAVAGAGANPGLPVWVGFTVGPDQGHDPELLGPDIELREGGLLSDAVALAAGYEAVDAMCIMHTDVRLAEPSLAALRQHWNGPVGVYAHVTEYDGDVARHDDVITPEEYADYLPAWQGAGATMIGGCCGIGPDHMRLVANHLQTQSA